MAGRYFNFAPLNKNSTKAQNIFMEKKKKTPEESAWQMFEKTGNPAYYMLYKKLKGLD